MAIVVADVEDVEEANKNDNKSSLFFKSEDCVLHKL